mmetsp:Transcript_30762/g.91322  ORF Transcript_30762/g.91322 Transcript_30762/m.91322 type:complete len:214 (+) Transcript_30762:453-1094(+)
MVDVAVPFRASVGLPPHPELGRHGAPRARGRHEREGRGAAGGAHQERAEDLRGHGRGRLLLARPQHLPLHGELHDRALHPRGQHDLPCRLHLDSAARPDPEERLHRDLAGRRCGQGRQHGEGQEKGPGPEAGPEPCLLALCPVPLPLDQGRGLREGSEAPLVPAGHDHDGRGEEQAHEPAALPVRVPLPPVPQPPRGVHGDLRARRLVHPEGP